MASAGAQVEEEEERRRLERSILEACTRSLEGADLLVSAFVQALHSYRRSSGMLLTAVTICGLQDYMRCKTTRG